MREFLVALNVGFTSIIEKGLVTPESTASTNKGRLGRPRKKKSFGDDFVHGENQGQWQIMCLFLFGDQTCYFIQDEVW